MQSRKIVILATSMAFVLLFSILDARPWGQIAHAGSPLTHRQSPTVTVPALVFVPLSARQYRPQASLLGVALEGYFDEAGLQQTLALHPRFGRRWRDIAWRDVEPKEGQYRWEVLAQSEDELRRAAGAGLTPILNVQMTPKWAQKNSPYACGPIKSEKFGAFADFMVQLVQRYGSNTEYGVRYWQIGNEPDIAVGIVPEDSVFGCWGSEEDRYFGGGQYGEMLKVVYPRIKEADPNALIVVGGLLLECDPYTGSVPATCKNQERLKSGLFLEGVLKAGGGAYFDILDIHSYGRLNLDLPAHMSDQYNWSPPVGGTGLPEKVAFVRRVLDQYGFGDKAIMSTELALRCLELSEQCQEAGAAYIPRVFAEAYGLRLAGAVYFALITEYHYKGLLLPDFTPKKQYFAYKFLASQLLGAEYERPVTELAGITGQEFKRNESRHLMILWSTDGKDQTIAPPAGFVQAYDKYGNVWQLDGRELTVGWSPIYVELHDQNIEPTG